MKKYLLIILLTLLITPFATAQVVKRTTKTPSFFVPDKALKQASEKETIPSAPLRTVGGAGAISNTFSPSSFRMQYKKAPIDDILKKQLTLSKSDKARYKQSIVKSFTLYPNDLNNLLQKELDIVNQETVRMQNIVQNLKRSSWAYQLANFELKRQISQDMVKNREHYKKIKQKFTKIINDTPEDQPVYIVEAKNQLFWQTYEVIKIVTEKKLFGSFHWQGSNHFKDVTFISIFDSNCKHLFSYYRQHLNMLKQKKITAPQQVGKLKIGQREVNIYQNLLNGYLTDLNRIGKGLDITNPQLLRQLNEMQNRQLSI